MYLSFSTICIISVSGDDGNKMCVEVVANRVWKDCCWHWSRGRAGESRQRLKASRTKAKSCKKKLSRICLCQLNLIRVDLTLGSRWKLYVLVHFMTYPLLLSFTHSPTLQHTGISFSYQKKLNVNERFEWHLNDMFWCHGTQDMPLGTLWMYFGVCHKEYISINPYCRLVSRAHPILFGCSLSLRFLYY